MSEENLTDAADARACAEQVGDVLTHMRSSGAADEPALDYYSRLLSKFNFEYDDNIPGVSDTTGTTITISPSAIEAQEIDNNELMSILVAEACHVILGHTTLDELRNPQLDQNVLAWSLDFMAHRHAYEVAPDLFENRDTVTVDELGDALADNMSMTGIALDMALTDDADVFDVYQRLKNAQDEGQEQGDSPDGSGGAGMGGGVEGDDDEGDDGDDQSHGGTGSQQQEGDQPKVIPLMGTTKPEPEPDEDEQPGQSVGEKMRAAAAEAEALNPEAFEAAAEAGTVPNNALLHAKKPAEALADWRDLVAEDLMPSDDPDSQTYAPLDRLTYTVSGGNDIKVLFPSSQSEVFEEVAILMDTSGSVASPAQQGVIAKELEHAIKSMGAEQSHVIYFDHEVKGMETFERDDELVLEPRGGGGTSFHAPFEFMAEKGMMPAHTVVITDGMAGWPPVWPGKTTWLIINNPRCEAPWGKTIHVSHKDLFSW